MDNILLIVYKLYITVSENGSIFVYLVTYLEKESYSKAMKYICYYLFVGDDFS